MVYQTTIDFQLPIRDELADELVSIGEASDRFACTITTVG